MTDTSDEAMTKLRKDIAALFPLEGRTGWICPVDHDYCPEGGCSSCVRYGSALSKRSASLQRCVLKSADAIDALRTERDAALSRAETAEARVERLREAIDALADLMYEPQCDGHMLRSEIKDLQIMTDTAPA